VVERLHLVRLETDQLWRAPGILYGFPRLGQLELLDAFGRHREGDDHALEFGTHNTAPDSRYDYLLLLSGTPRREVETLDRRRRLRALQS